MKKEKEDEEDDEEENEDDHDMNEGNWKKVYPETGRVKFLAIKDNRNRAHKAIAIPSKGAKEYIAKRVRTLLGNWGRNRIRMRSDGENAIRAVKRGIKEVRGEETIIENSPPGDARANGHSESAVKLIKGKARTLKAALEKRIGATLAHGSYALPWLVEHASDLITLCRIGSDGRTAYERIKGAKYKGELVEFGERILYYKIEEQANKEDFEPRWHQGIWLGVDLDTMQKVVGTEHGVVKSNTIKRTPFEERWSREALEGMRGLPWDRKSGGNTGGNKTGGGGGGRTHDDELSDKPKERSVCDEPGKPRNFRITKRMVQKFGQTPGCPGCGTALKPGRTEAHDDLCRTRMQEEMTKSEEGRARREEARRRFQEYGQKREEQRRDPIPYAPHPASEAARRRSARRDVESRAMRPRVGEEDEEEEGMRDTKKRRVEVGREHEPTKQEEEQMSDSSGGTSETSSGSSESSDDEEMQEERNEEERHGQAGDESDVEMGCLQNDAKDVMACIRSLGADRCDLNYVRSLLQGRSRNS